MDVLKRYSILFVGLKQGIHHYDFIINDEFWESFPFAVIHKSKVNVHLNFDKKNNFFTLGFDINGTVNVECDRCSVFFDLLIHYENQIIVKFTDRMPDNLTGHPSGDIGRDENEDIIFISRSESEFNVAHLIYELINIAVPMYKVHPDNAKGESTCNKTILKEIKKHSPKEDHKNSDPRWEKLREISNN